LDEWAGGQAEWLVPLETFMADFRLDDSGGMVFKGFGEETDDLIWNHCYPELRALLSSSAIRSNPGEYSTAEKEILRERSSGKERGFGITSRKALRRKPNSESASRRQWEPPAQLRAAKRILESDAGEDGKRIDAAANAKRISAHRAPPRIDWLINLQTEGSSRVFDRITFDPTIMGGRACIRGMRITVSLVVNLVANGMTTGEIIREYPDLEPDDVREALGYASALANEEIRFFTSPAA
jgi:uncharacterized protein (DUF433 family)